MARTLHSSRNRETGTGVLAADNRDGKLRLMPPHNKVKWPKGWITVCLDHTHAVKWPTRVQAAERMAHPTEWCAGCKGGQAKRRGGDTPLRDGPHGQQDADRLAVYRVCFLEWAPHMEEIVNLTGLSEGAVRKHLHSLNRTRLVESHRVNGEPPAVHQTMHDYENGALWEEALADYNAAYGTEHMP